MKTDIKQHDITDCGAASICSVARYYGHDIPLTVIRESSGTDSLGTSAKGVLDACRALGFEAGGYKSPDRDVQALKGLDSPAILHVVKDNGDLHFVVLYGFRRGRAVIMDPALGKHVRISTDRLRTLWSGYLIIMTPDPGKAVDRQKSVSSFKRIFSILACYPGDFLMALLGSFIYMVAGIFTAVFLQRVIDRLIPSGDIPALLSTGLLMGLITICSLIIGYCRSIYMLRAGIRIDGSLILNYLRHLFSLPAGFFAHRSTGELNSRISDAMKVRNFLISGMTEIFTGIAILGASAVLMFNYNWQLALITFAFVPLYIILFVISDQVNRKVRRRLIEDAAAFEEQSVECISSISTLKHFDRSGTAYLKLERRYATLCGSLFSGGRTVSAFATAGEAISKLMVITVLTFGAAFILKGRLTTGELVSFYSLMAYFSSPLIQLSEISEEYSEARIAMERLMDITLLEPEDKGALELSADRALDIHFNDISFSYPGCPTLLEHFNLDLPAGRITAICGESGCGKSSLAALLMRDYRPGGGRILLDGTDISLIDISQWRSYVSIVPQDPALMNCSVLDNITGASRDPDTEKVSGLISELGLKDFITGLPMGILTVIGERGALLSGGQRQRLAMARALYRDPKVLILDEATSSLDEESQRYILSAARSFCDDGGSVMMITHRSDNAAMADCIFNMNKTDCANGRSNPHT